jgi:hypothetical protein
MKVEEDGVGPNQKKGKGRSSIGEEGPVKEVQVRGVRVCRECWGTVSYGDSSLVSVETRADG